MMTGVGFAIRRRTRTRISMSKSRRFLRHEIQLNRTLDSLKRPVHTKHSSRLAVAAWNRRGRRKGMHPCKGRTRSGDRAARLRQDGIAIDAARLMKEMTRGLVAL